MKIDKQEIEEIFQSKISLKYVAEELKLNRASLQKYRSDASRIDGMTLSTAEKLQSFYNKGGIEYANYPKIIGIKKAVGEFNNWQGSARIYFDKNRNRVECYTYSGPGSFEEFQDKSIVQVVQKATISIIERDNTITMAELSACCLQSLEE